MKHTTRLTAAGCSVTVASGTRAVTDRALRYFGPWWSAAPAQEPEAREPAVHTEIDKTTADDLIARIQALPATTVEYAGQELLIHRDEEGAVPAVQEQARLAYAYRF